MPFGQNCEHPNFKACTDKMTGKVDDPEAYCATLMRRTEQHCRGKEVALKVTLEEMKALCPSCAEKMTNLNMTALKLSWDDLQAILDKQASDGSNLAVIEKQIRDEELEALEAFRKGTAPAPILYKPMGALKATEGGIMTFVASEESEDRLGDIIHIDGWALDNYMKNPVFLYGHDHAIPPIGSVPKVWVEGKQLLNMVKWDMDDPFAAFVKGKYERGFMKALSVGFRPLEFGQRKDSAGGMEFVKQELLEISAVAVPAHPTALLRALGSRHFGLVLPHKEERMEHEGETYNMAGMKGKLQQMRAAMSQMSGMMDDMEGMMGGSKEDTDIETQVMEALRRTANTFGG